MDALGLVWPDDDAGLLAALHDRIDPGLHRQKHSGNARSPFAGEFYSQLLKASAGADLRQATEPLVNRYCSAKQLFAPAFSLLEKESRLHAEKRRELQILQERLEQARLIIHAFAATRSGALLQKYQMFRMRISNQSAAGAPLERLQRILDEK